jgi:hypothetical protein
MVEKVPLIQLQQPNLFLRCLFSYNAGKINYLMLLIQLHHQRQFWICTKFVANRLKQNSFYLMFSDVPKGSRSRR